MFMIYEPVIVAVFFCRELRRRSIQATRETPINATVHYSKAAENGTHQTSANLEHVVYAVIEPGLLHDLDQQLQQSVRTSYNGVGDAVIYADLEKITRQN